MNSLSRLFFILLAGSALTFAACDKGETEEASEEATTEEAVTEEGAEEAATDEAATEEGTEEAATDEAAAVPADGAAPTAGTGDIAAATARMIGTWSADMAGMVMEGITPEEETMMRAMLGSMVLTMTLNADGTQVSHSEMMGQVNDEPGTWVVMAVEGDTYTVNLMDEENPAGDPGTLVFTDDNTFNLVEADEGRTTTIPFRRQP